MTLFPYTTLFRSFTKAISGDDLERMTNKMGMRNLYTPILRGSIRNDQANSKIKEQVQKTKKEERKACCVKNVTQKKETYFDLCKITVGELNILVRHNPSIERGSMKSIHTRLEPDRREFKTDMVQCTNHTELKKGTEQRHLGLSNLETIDLIATNGRRQPVKSFGI